MMPSCMIPFTCLPCHVYFSCISFVSMFAFIILFMHCSKVCSLMLADCVPNLFCLYIFNRNSVWVFFTCNLIRISCTLCLCYCLLLLTNLKYGLGQNNTKCFNFCGVLSVIQCLGCASLKLTSIDSLPYASPLVMFVFYV